MKKSVTISIIVILAILIAGGAFYGGMVYGKSQTQATRGNFSGVRTRQGGGAGANFISGNIISKDSTSITLQLPNSGGSKIIFYSDTTPINKFAAGTSTDLSAGVSVSVTGTANSDGSVTAQSIQIRPAGQNSPGPRTPGQ